MVRNLLEVEALSGVDCLAQEDMKSLGGLDYRAYFACGQLKKGLIEGRAELAPADHAEITAVTCGSTVRIKLSLVAKALRIVLQAGVNTFCPLPV